MSKPDRHALALIDDPKFAVEKSQLGSLQKRAIAQLAAINQGHIQLAGYAVFAGITLCRLKKSMPHGEFRRWLAQMSASGGHLAAPKKTQANYYMQLAEKFHAKHKVQLPALLALPGDQTALDLGDSHPSRDLVVKVTKFVGDCSLNELLDRHGIRAKKALGGARKAGASDKAAVLDPDDLEQQAAEEIGGGFVHLEGALEQNAQYLRDKTLIRGIQESHEKIGRTIKAAFGKTK